jgi:hypothetical protein
MGARRRKAWLVRRQQRKRNEKQHGSDDERRGNDELPFLPIQLTVRRKELAGRYYSLRNTLPEALLRGISTSMTRRSTSGRLMALILAKETQAKAGSGKPED